MGVNYTYIVGAVRKVKEIGKVISCLLKKHKVMLVSAPKIDNTNGPCLWFHWFRRPWIYTAHWVHISNRCWNVYVPERPEPCSILLWPFVKFDFLSKYFKLWLNSEILVLSDSARWKYNLLRAWNFCSFQTFFCGDSVIASYFIILSWVQ